MQLFTIKIAEESRIQQECEAVGDLILKAERKPYCDLHFDIVKDAIEKNDTLKDQFLHEGIHF